MNQTHNTHLPESHRMVSDELDIKKLFMTLWQGKWIIILVTLVFAISVYALSYLMTPVWTATAITIKPGSDEVGNFSMVQQSVNSLDLSSSEKDVTLSVNDVIYRQFIETISSYDFKRQFWMDSDYYLNQAKPLKTDHEKAVLLEKLILNIQFIAQDDRKGNQDTLLLKAETAKTASDLLRAYIDKANQTVINNLSRQSDKARTNLIADLERVANNLTHTAEDKFKLKVTALETELNEALDQYKQLSVRADALPNELESLNIGISAIKTLLNEINLSGPQYDDRLNEYQLKLKELDRLPQISQFEQAFRFLRTPYEPISPDSPRRVFWAFLAALFGGFVGVCIALIRGPKVNQA